MEGSKGGGGGGSAAADRTHRAHFKQRKTRSRQSSASAVINMLTRRMLKLEADALTKMDRFAPSVKCH